MKIRPVGAELFHEDEHTGMMNVRNFTNALKNQNSIPQFYSRFNSRGSVMRIVTRLHTRGNRVGFPAEARVLPPSKAPRPAVGPTHMPNLSSTGGYFSGWKASEAWAWKFFYLVPNFRASAATTSLCAEGHVTFTPHFDLWLLHHVHNTDG